MIHFEKVQKILHKGFMLDEKQGSKIKSFKNLFYRAIDAFSFRHIKEKQSTVFASNENVYT